MTEDRENKEIKPGSSNNSEHEPDLLNPAPTVEEGDLLNPIPDNSEHDLLNPKPEPIEPEEDLLNPKPKSATENEDLLNPASVEPEESVSSVEPQSDTTGEDLLNPAPVVDVAAGEPEPSVDKQQPESEEQTNYDAYQEAAHAIRRWGYDEAVKVFLNNLDELKYRMQNFLSYLSEKKTQDNPGFKAPNVSVGHFESYAEQFSAQIDEVCEKVEADQLEVEESRRNLQ